MGLLLVGVGAPAAVAQTTTTSQAAPVFQEKTSAGSITLRVRPVWNDSILVFEITADTHSGDLAQLDFRKAVRLRLDGRDLEPVSATRLSGHHGKATVSFPLPAPPATFVLVIRAVGDVPERVLVWPGADSSDGGA
jgi:hypothetical protein